MQVHLLCLLSHGLQLNRKCNNQLDHAILLSLTHTRFSLCDPAALSNEDTLLQLLKW